MPEQQVCEHMAHWVPCPGGCGLLMPPGQRCFRCAAEAVKRWKESHA